MQSYERMAHFKYVPLPGGDLAAKQPWRMALSYLIDAYGENYPLDHRRKPWRNVGRRKIKGVEEMIKQGVNSPPSVELWETVRCGVLPDRSGTQRRWSLKPKHRCGWNQVAADGPALGSYRFSILEEAKCPAPAQISFAPMIKAILKDLGRGIPASVISVKFHNTLARVILTDLGKDPAELWH